jgi:ABC-type amino acid transport substrate-binding protein
LGGPMKPANRFRLAPAFAAALVLPSVAASAGTVDRIRQEQTVRIAYRQDAPPFSYKDRIGEPAGLMVDLCR